MTKPDSVQILPDLSTKLNKSGHSIPRSGGLPDPRSGPPGSTPICRCRVLYLGSAVPHVTKDGLQGIQEPLRELYPEEGAHGAKVDSIQILLDKLAKSGHSFRASTPGSPSGQTDFSSKMSTKIGKRSRGFSPLTLSIIARQCVTSWCPGAGEVR